MEASILHYTIRLVFALLVGGLIGIEREIKDKPAGMRTNMLMCMGSCLIMILSIEVARMSGHQGDPGRIAAQVITGVGFLGAGTIIQSRLSISGLTTAATIWFVAAIGLVIGAGHYLLSVIAALLILLTLTTLGKFEKKLSGHQRRHLIQFRLAPNSTAMNTVKRLLYDNNIMPEDVSLNKEGGSTVVYIEYVAPNKKHQALMEKMTKIEGAEEILDF
jgi:putative Mg2+ transporter-C (MgtC) family protein